MAYGREVKALLNVSDPVLWAENDHGEANASPLFQLA